MCRIEISKKKKKNRKVTKLINITPYLLYKTILRKHKNKSKGNKANARKVVRGGSKINSTKNNAVNKPINRKPKAPPADPNVKILDNEANTASKNPKTRILLFFCLIFHKLRLKAKFSRQ